MGHTAGSESPVNAAERDRAIRTTEADGDDAEDTTQGRQGAEGTLLDQCLRGVDTHP